MGHQGNSAAWQEVIGYCAVGPDSEAMCGRFLSRTRFQIFSSAGYTQLLLWALIKVEQVESADLPVVPEDCVPVVRILHLFMHDWPSSGLLLRDVNVAMANSLPAQLQAMDTVAQLLQLWAAKLDYIVCFKITTSFHKTYNWLLGFLAHFYYCRHQITLIGQIYLWEGFYAFQTEIHI